MGEVIAFLQFLNLDEAGDSLVFLSLRDISLWHIFPVQQASGASLYQ